MEALVSKNAHARPIMHRIGKLRGRLAASLQQILWWSIAHALAWAKKPNELGIIRLGT